MFIIATSILLLLAVCPILTISFMSCVTLLFVIFTIRDVFINNKSTLSKVFDIMYAGLLLWLVMLYGNAIHTNEFGNVDNYTLLLYKYYNLFEYGVILSTFIVVISGIALIIDRRREGTL